MCAGGESHGSYRDDAERQEHRGAGNSDEWGRHTTEGEPCHAQQRRSSSGHPRVLGQRQRRSRWGGDGDTATITTSERMTEATES
jgi:hypothetical protein